MGLRRTSGVIASDAGALRTLADRSSEALAGGPVRRPARKTMGAWRPIGRVLVGDRHHDGVRVLGLQLSTLAVLAVLHRHARDPGVDYVGVFVAAGVSWLALPGPGEAALIAAGISAAHGHLDLAAVVAVAWAGASVGGTAGWIVGAKGGRGLLTAAGPLHHLRLALIARGDRFYERYGPVAVLFTPSWIAGIHDMRWSRFLPANAVSALAWALSVGVGAYLVGPSVTDIVADAGLAGGLLVGALFVLAVVLVVWRRSHKPA
jgi:membrane protein DedA with SNARE-associated domain